MRQGRARFRDLDTPYTSSRYILLEGGESNRGGELGVVILSVFLAIFVKFYGFFGKRGN